MKGPSRAISPEPWSLSPVRGLVIAEPMPAIIISETADPQFLEASNAHAVSRCPTE